MARKTPSKSTLPAAKLGVGYAKLVQVIGQVNCGMVARAAVAVNQSLVLRNWLIGAYIVGFEQHGSDRAKYGARLLETLAADLKAQGIKGLGAEVLRTSRLFFLSYPEISHTLRGKLELPPGLTAISQPVCGKSGDGTRQPVVVPSNTSTPSAYPLMPRSSIKHPSPASMPP